MERTYDDLKRTLVNLNLANNQDVNEHVVYKEDELHAVLEHTGSNPKLVKQIRKAMIKVSYGFKFKLTINGKEWTVKYPTLIDKLKEYNYSSFYKDTFILASLITILYIVAMGILIKHVPQNEIKVIDISGKLLDVSALISSFVITYLTSKVLTIRQEKLNRVEKIRDLSNRLTEFRRVCYVVLNSWQFWQPSANVHAHGRNVAKQLDFNDLYEVDVYDDRYDEINQIMNYDNYGYILPKFVVQLETLCKSKSIYLHNRLFLGMRFLANYVYSVDELKGLQFLPDHNLFWYIFDHERQDYANSFNFQISQDDRERIMRCAVRLDPSLANNEFDGTFLIKASQVAENEIIPELTILVKKNEAKQPFLITYLLSCFAGIFVFGVLLQVIFPLFFSSLLTSYVSIIAVTAIFIHILICMPTILSNEIKFRPKYDYN